MAHNHGLYGNEDEHGSIDNEATRHLLGGFEGDFEVLSALLGIERIVVDRVG